MATVVTAWYRISSKFPSQTYKEWMKNFFRLGCRFIVFTDARSREDLPEESNCIKIFIKEMSNFQTSEWDPFWEFCESIDIEKKTGVNHTKELYKVWNEKPFFMTEAAEKNPHDSEWFCWCDIGCVRNKDILPKSIGFPNAVLNGVPRDRILFSMVGTPTQRDSHIIDGISEIFLNKSPNTSADPVIRVQGGFFAGMRPMLLQYATIWRNEINIWQARKNFAGKDQYLMYNLVLKSQGAFFALLPPNKTACPNEWFSFLPRMGAVPVFSAKIQGGLGNQMFQVAAAHAVAKANGGYAIFNRNEPRTERGNTHRGSYWTTVFRNFSTHDDIQAGWQNIQESWNHAYTPFPRLYSNTMLQGYFQSAKYFGDHREEMRDLLAFRPEVRQWAQNFFATRGLNPTDVTAVHVRLGDYIKLGWNLPLEFYKGAIQRAKVLLIFSDEPDSCKTMFDDAIFVENGTDEEQMCLLSMAGELVMSNSSFSWWAAFLGNHKRVTAPEPWFKNTNYCNEIYEPGWERMRV